MSAPRIRIFSDLHFGDPNSTIRNLHGLKPLFGDADEIILNGDTLDAVSPQTSTQLPAVRAFFASPNVPRVTFISGNHDPEISDHAELSLADERVWITHGDVLFENIAPWSHYATELERRLVELARDISPDELIRIETRLRLNRLATGNLFEPPEFFKTHTLANAGRIVRTLFPPRRLLTMLKAWRDAPHLAANLARTQRPRARLVVLGHTHHPGVWRPDGPSGVVVVNTGSFSRPFGGAFVELVGDKVRVVRIKRSGGAFAPGRILDEFTL